MRLQLALDRMSIEQAITLASLTKNYIDIIEVGTSLIKEFGLESVRKIKKAFPNQIVLADIKTIDEGAYEFRAAYQAGADIATVMAASSLETLESCYQVASDFGKQMMIDVLEENREKIKRLESLEQAIFCIHSSTDQAEKNVLGRLKDFKKDHPNLEKRAIAGGIKLEDIPNLRKEGIDIVIIGSSITGADQPERQAQSFQVAMS